MIRVLLIILAVLVAILAFILDRLWLYVAAAVPLGVALALFARRLWAAYQTPSPPDDSRRGRQSSTRESLHDLGIMEVRPQQRAIRDRPSDSAAATDTSAAETSAPRNGTDAQRAPSRDADVATVDAETEPTPSTDDAASEASSSPASNASEAVASSAPSPSVPGVRVASDPRETPVVGPLVQSLRAALDAHTVCLLVQEEVALEYRILAIASASPHARSEGRFATEAPLLTATMTQHAVTIREIEGGEADPRVLGYYRERETVDHVALAPVVRPNEPATFFVLADATSETDLGSGRARTLLERFADVLALLLQEHEASADVDAVFDDVMTIDRTTTASEAAAAEAAQAALDAERTPRPRSEIIAEEMREADVERHELALVLVHLNRAESIARHGDEAVASAERLLRIRLEDAAPGSRVARFGELTYGVFFRGGVDQVEPWAIDLQSELAEETGELEGGASIGVAVRGPRHERPETLRADATQALREAYETGTCTIIE